MKLIYRGRTYERHSSRTSGRPFVQVRELDRAAYNLTYRKVRHRIPNASVEVPASLLAYKFIYRGVAHYKLIYSNTILLVNRHV